MAPVDLESVVEDVALKLRKIRVLKLGLPSKVLAPRSSKESRRRFGAVVQALVVNAVEASPPDSSVVVELSSWGEGVQLRVLDQGPGIPEEVLDRLFEPHTTTKAAGSGMGLYLAHRISTHYYGGELELNSFSRRGS